MTSNTSVSECTSKWHEDSYASTFSGIGDFQLANYVNFPTILHYIGDVKGKTVLDIACGEGNFCRFIKSKGASRVVGVDISNFLLESSRKQGGDSIEYQYGDAFNLGVIGQFDFVTANRFLPYAETKTHLKKMCQTFYNNLKEGGRFAGIGMNVFEDPNYETELAHLGILKYVAVPSSSSEVKLAEIHMKNNKGNTFKALTFYYEPEVYEETFKEVGFRNFSFKPITIDDREPQPHGYWDIVRNRPFTLCYYAEK